VVYLVILLGLAVVIAPLMSAMPSKAQRAKAGLRDQARAHDLRVSLRPLPAVPARFRFEPEDELACYERRFPVSQQKSGGQVHYLCVDGLWWPTTGVEDVPGWLHYLPLGAAYVECRDESVSIFWDEKAGPEGLAKISQAIDLMN
jgi:hypothetical protein